MKKLLVQFLYTTLLWGLAKASVCDVVPCQNGGVCVEAEAEFTGHHFDGASHKRFSRGTTPYHCKCEPHFTGVLCEIPYDDCSGPQFC